MLQNCAVLTLLAFNRVHCERLQQVQVALLQVKAKGGSYSSVGGGRGGLFPAERENARPQFPTDDCPAASTGRLTIEW